MKIKRTLALYLIIAFVFSAFSSVVPGRIGQSVFAEDLGTGTEPENSEPSGELNQDESGNDLFQVMSVSEEVYGIKNPGFDDPSTSPWFVSGGWNSEGSIHSISTDHYRSAPNSVKVNNKRSGNDLYQTVDVEPNTDYIFSFYAKTEIDEALRFYVTTSPSWEPVLSAYSQTDCSNGEWKQYAVAFNSGEANKAIVVITDCRFPLVDSISYIDDVALSTSDYALDAAKAAAGELNEYDYTAESWDVLEDALSMPEETNAQMALKMTAINNAITGLEREYNLIRNPGFDDPSTSPWFVSGGWNSEDSIHSISTGHYRSAPNSVKVNNKRSGNDLYQTVDVEPNTDYIFSFYAKTEIDEALRFYVTTSPGWEPVLSAYSQTDRSNNEWKQYAVAFNSGEANKIIAVITDCRFPSVDSISYIDDVELLPSSLALDKAKAAASEKTQADYSEESWETLAEALSMPETTNAEMAAKTAAINNAISGLMPAEIEPKTYYVSPDGDDENTGTSEDEAWASLEKAGSEARAGDTVIFLDGEYEGSLVPQNSGTAGAPITFKAQNPGNVLFKGDPNLTGMQFAISINGKSYINIDGIHIEMQSINYGRWLRITKDGSGKRAHDINITNCLMENATGSPETLNAFDNTCPVALSYCDNIIIKYNIIRELRRMDDMISIKYATGILFEGNEISKAPHVSLVTNCRDEFFYEGDHGDGNYDNRIYNVRNLVIRNNVFNTQTGRRFSIYPSENVLIEGNVFSENVNGGGNANGADKILTKQGIYRFNRVMRNSIFPIEIAPYEENQFVENLRIYNNVFAENANCAIFYSDHESRVIDNIIKNNIFYNNDNKADHINMRFLRKADDLELENDNHMKIHSNLFWHDDGAEPCFVSWDGWPVNIWLHTLSSLQPSNKFRNNINEDPLFADAANYNFALEDDSPALDAAEALTTAVNSGEDSMELIVDDAGYFYDGWDIPGETGDIISVGSAGNIAVITDIDYENNIITLDREISWNEGDEVNLAISGDGAELGIYEMGDTGRVSVQIETQPFKLVEGESVTLTAIVHGACTPDSYSWRFGDGTESDSGSTVTHTYSEPGQYSIFCTVTGNDGKVYIGCSYVIVYAQDALKKPLRYLTFDDDDNNWEWYLNTGMSDSLYDDDKSVEKITDGSNGYLRFYINYDDSKSGKDFMGELFPNEWNINHYPIVKARYKIKPGTPVAMYLCNYPSYNFYENRLTDIGENIVYVAASPGCGMDTPFALIDDNEWHDITIDARDYFDTDYIQSVGFKNPTKPQFANPGDEWYLDSFSIEPDENLLDNPGFEEPSASPWQVSEGWDGSNYSVITDDPDNSMDDPHRGSKCIRLDNKKSRQDIWQVVNVEPNTDYIFSFFAKVGYDQALSCTVYTVNWDGITGSIRLGASQDWTQYAIAFNSGNLTEVMLVIEDFGGATYSGECVSYIDDVDLRPAASALERAKEAAARNESIYTAESWQVLSAALEMPETTLSEILAKTTVINNAIAALELKRNPLTDGITYYVGPDGSDSNDGKSAESAWKSLSKAASEALAGDTVIFLDGEYEGSLVPQNSGIAEAPITFKAQNPGKVLFKGDPNLTGMQFAISINGKSYINIDGIHIEMQSINFGRWLRITKDGSGNRAHDINITNCVMENATGSPDTLNAFDDTSPVTLSFCDNIRLKGNIIRELRRMDDMFSIKEATNIVLDSNQISKSFHSGLVINCLEPYFSTVENLVIRNNVFNAQWGRNSSIFPSKNVLIEGNIFSENINGGGSAYGADKILADQGIYRFNRVMRNADFAVEEGPWNDDDHAYPMYVRNIRFYNNVFVENAKSVFVFSELVSQINNNIFKNNIFYNNDNYADHVNLRYKGDASSVKFEGNLFWHGEGIEPNLASWDDDVVLRPLSSLQQPSDQFSDNVNYDPEFIDPENYNFALVTGSPAIDSASALTTALNAGYGSTELIVSDARYFYDGWGIPGETGDIISVGSAENKAEIIHVDYDNNVITLKSPISWQIGDDVNLEYSGDGPDLGMHEMGSDGRVSVQIAVESFKITAGNSVTFTANVYGTNPETVSWNFGDGSEKGSGSTVSHTYDEEGQYAIFCTVTAEDGKEYTGCSYVIVQDPDVLKKPFRFSTFDADDNDWEEYINTGVRDSLYENITVEQLFEGSNGYIHLYATNNEYDLCAEYVLNDWNIDNYPVIKARYKVKPGTPVALFVNAFPSYNWDFNSTKGHRTLIIAASPACGLRTERELIADNEWHTIEVDAREIRKKYPDVVFASVVGFKNMGKPAEVGDEWYLDYFSIEPDGNMLINAGFEDPTTDPWEVSGGWEESNYSISTDNPHSGSKCIKLNNRKSCHDIWQIVDVEPNTDYIFTFFARVGYDQALSCNAYTVDWTGIPGSTRCSKSQEWTQYAIAFNSLNNTKVMLVIEDYSGATYPEECVSYIDDADLRPAASALEKAKAAAVRKESVYTAESWAVLSAALNMPETTLNEILAKTTAINNAIERLEKVTDLTEYYAALEAVVEEEYTKESWAAYLAVVAANAVTEENTQAEVDEATANIIAAQANLVPALVKKTVVAVTASKFPEDAEKTIDGIINDASSWCADGDGVYITYDLGSVTSVSKLNIAWYSGNLQKTTYDIAVSTDGETFTNVVTGAQSSGTTVDFQLIYFQAADARYVRIIGHGNTSQWSAWCSINEVEIYGPVATLTPTPTPTPTPTEAPEPTDKPEPSDETEPADEPETPGQKQADTQKPSPTPVPPEITIKETSPDGRGRSFVTATTSIEVDADSEGKAVATIDGDQITQAIGKALEEAARRGGGTEARLEISIKTPSAANSLDINIAQDSFNEISESGDLELTISTPVADITFTGEALDGISGESSGDIRISVSKVDTDTLTDEVKNIVGGRPVYDFNISSGDKAITEFGGRVTVSIPYTPKAGEDIDAIVIYYINSEGELEIVSNCRYDPVTGMVSFTTDHFSRYAVGYNKVSFTDVAATAWYGKAVEFIAARGITKGTGDNKFSPDGILTRGQFIVMMLRAYGIKPDENPTDNFDDAGNTYYTGYLAAAKRLGISKGIGNNKFGPEIEITRQEMFTLLYNTLNEIGESLSNVAGKDLTDFSDAGQIAPWAKDAIEKLVKAGIVSGANNMILPGETASRAQMAQTMYNLLSK